MINHKLRKILSAAIATSLVGTSIPAMDYTQVIAADKNVAKADSADVISEDDEGVFKVTMDETGKLTADNEYAADVDTPFSWDNANVYFVITDRFENGDDSNDHAYERSTTEQGASSYSTRIGTFHGGDLAGMTKKIEEGYFDELGTNAIWITAPYEQIHGALCSTQFKHYAYHGYYTLDYTNVDGNMGTEKDLETFIDTAHSHGIRVIFDIVMNHAGYADAYTANEYGFGKLADNWEEIYYKWDESKYNWYNDYAGEAEAQGSQGMMIADGDWTTNWWGTGWIRAIGERLGGYEGSEGDSNPLTQCLNGLPDFKVETSGDPGIPAILKNKWTKEGNYDEKVAMTKESMSKGGLSASVTGYISAWLSQWVREYGVDGFRCDTAKHVAVSEWSKLKKACVAALNDWREENPDKPGAQWSDDFWMTGEHWDHGVGKDEYYTSGAFDSMINFSYKGIESKTGSGLEGTYSSYAKQINSDPDFNVLSYISSHDTSLGARSASAGTALLLTPGGVQTYYGDESGRTAGAGSGDQPTRSHMNWSSTDKKVLENWQKVGRFRRNHISVGAGQHKQLNASPYTFSRTYTGEATVGAEKKIDYEDKVVVCLPGKAGTYDVSVGDVFEDGETVKDEYSGEEYTVSGGQVSAECDANGVILLAGTGISKPSVGASPGSKSYTTDTLTIKLSASKTESAYYTINGGEQISFENGDTVEIGGDCEIGDSTTIVVGGVGEDGSEIAEKTFTFTKEKEPDYTFYLRIAKDSFKTAPNVFVYGTDAAETAYSAAWPGDTMEEEGDYYVYKSKDYSEARVIFTSNDDTWRYPADMQPGFLVSGYAEYEKDGDVKAFTPSQSGTAT